MIIAYITLCVHVVITSSSLVIVYIKPSNRIVAGASLFIGVNLKCRTVIPYTLLCILIAPMCAFIIF